MELIVEGISGFIILILTILAIVEIVRSPKTLGMKVLWIALILVLPLVGLILYALLGRRTFHASPR